MTIILKEPLFSSIPLFTEQPSYCVDVYWNLLETFLETHQRYALDLEPDFQRAHVWTEAQQMAFVEYVLRGGRSGLDLYFNHPGWGNSVNLGGGPYVIVDGKQRLEAARRFLRGEIRAFGYRFQEYRDSPRFHLFRFRWNVNALQTRAEVLTWYLEMNTGGTPHTKAELARVHALLDRELSGG